jgi:octaheme c-type cytochrome (tetrathionate reductase family)
MPRAFVRPRFPSVIAKLFFGAAFAVGMVLIGDAAFAAGDATSNATQTRATASKSTADHTKYKELRRDFKTGPEVTEACLECHTEASKQIHKTTHWTWAFKNPITGQELGKKNIINNFCVATATNLPRCTSCHIGYGWKDDKFDFASEKSVDCLICHDTTGTYKKFPVGAGHPAYEDKKFMGKPFKAVNLPKVAQSVGQPSRKNCGTCHFMSGGGDAVKHGDLDSTMFNPDRSLDVHMDAKGLNFACTTCHTAGSHDVTGSRYVTKAVDRVGIDVPGHTDDSRATCESCHGLTPHPETNHPKLNDHTDKVACTTCHVPEFARGGKKTKMWWDWSTAGKMKEKGKLLVKKNEAGDVVYHTLKGSFKWEGDVVPEYYWYDGRIDYTLMGQKIDDTDVVNINSISGKYGDPDSRIWPFKVMRGKQPYDKKNKILALPHLFGKDKNAFWGNFDWNKAIAAGMQSRNNMEYSGEYGFVETRYYWPILHMVAPKEDAVACNQCHTTENGRLATLSGFYMPGRDSYPWLSKLGWVAAALSLLGVIIHMLVRIVMNGRRS